MKSRSGVDHPGELRWETRLLVVITATLTVFGIASVYSASSFAPEALGEVFKQLVGAAIGAIALIVASRIDYQRWRDWARAGARRDAGAAADPAAARHRTTFAPRINGARRWLALPGMSVQPSEIARFSIVVWAAMMAEKKGEVIRQSGRHASVPVTGATSLLVLLEPNSVHGHDHRACGAVVLFTAGARSASSCPASAACSPWPRSWPPCTGFAASAAFSGSFPTARNPPCGSSTRPRTASPPAG
ncbi:MAG: FtsW/RodA/SpoVE family cell cycle protein [Gemmatimonadales bacterium]